MIKLKFTAQLKEKTGLAVDQIEITNGEKLQSILKRLADRYGKGFATILFDDTGNFRNSILIAINEYQENYKDNPTLKNGDELILMSPIAGG